MKVKVKGLVFVGFAAAVFAQSAFADTAQDAADMKTVTSKYYVDQTFKKSADIRTSIITDSEATGYNANSETLYPSISAVTGYVGTAVSNAVTGLSADVATNSTSYLNFSETNGAFEVGLDNVPATTAAELTGAIDGTTGLPGTLTTTAALVTAGAVNALINPTGSNGTTLNSSSTNATVPTSKNVYDFVTNTVGGAGYQPKVATSDNTTVYVGRNGTGNAPTWDALSTDGYVTTDTATSGVYKITLDSNKITGGSDFGTISTGNASGATEVQQTAAATSETKLATAGAVYNYVEGRMSDAGNTYQAKATATGTSVQIGYDGGWQTLGGSTYVTVTGSGSGATVALQGIAGTTTGANDATVSSIGNGATGTDLPTVANVQTYVAEQLAALPMNAAANSLPEGCQDGTHYCALVAHAATTGGTITYEWTVMAPTSSN